MARARSKRRKASRRRFKDRDRKTCHGSVVDYKEVDVLRKLMTASGKVLSRKRAGTTAMEQRDVCEAIKRARFIGLLPFAGA